MWLPYALMLTWNRYSYYIQYNTLPAYPSLHEPSFEYYLFSFLSSSSQHKQNNYVVDYYVFENEMKHK